MKEATDPANCWQTPLEILAALGPFDLDPCANDQAPTRCAVEGFTAADDGLSQPWEGRVFCNPPYGRHSRKWLERCAQHGMATALVTPKSIGAAWFQAVLRGSTVLFLRGRLPFIEPTTGRPAAANTQWSMLIAWGDIDRVLLQQSGIPGLCVEVPA